MEALWDFIDKLKISTLGAILLLACACFGLVCFCIIIVLKRKGSNNNKIVNQEGRVIEENETSSTITTTTTTSTTTTNATTTTTDSTKWLESNCGWISVKRVLMESMVWSRARKLEENIGWQRERGSPLLGSLQRNGVENGWKSVSHDSASAVWQRPILRGEKCELPSFSGLILYDEKGKLLNDSVNETQCMEISKQEEIDIITVRTTLKDLL
ncbi:uncharacterized protein LOC131639507 [Vicia villosa]|uniref:uncharacterized protein LOC131639507 n=1 Tax=Vicia villosa TaxID=3911 RepID=UPI00273C69A8|nr:uncharacterized protein LOC131639507 [Vicia villosa]